DRATIAKSFTLPCDLAPRVTSPAAGEGIAREVEEQQEREDMRMNDEIARDAEVARIHAEEEIQ
nr:hypothetical protein [Tanacetum cinerariifolium]